MGKAKILIVDDEEDILELLKFHLLREGYDVNCVGTGDEALEMVRKQIPSLIILDLMLPGISGLDLCRILKNDSSTAGIPIIMLTAKSEDIDIVTGLELGADDYVTKPFSPRVLMARVRRILRKTAIEHETKGIVTVHGLKMDPARCEVTIDGESLELTYSEFNILYTMAKRPGMVFTRNQIVDSIHGGDYVVSDRAIDVHIAYLRRKLGLHKDYIQTVRGVGYRLKD
jgi:two-component system alkaline phosphatase synthesis response regulator PhoP